MWLPYEATFNGSIIPLRQYWGKTEFLISKNLFLVDYFNIDINWKHINLCLTRKRLSYTSFNLVFAVLISSLQFSCYFNFGWLQLQLRLQLHNIIVGNYIYTYTSKGDNPLILQCTNTWKEFNSYNAHIQLENLDLHGFIETRRRKAVWPLGLGHWIWNLEFPSLNLPPYCCLDLFLVFSSSTPRPHCM